jgi:WD40 repeat protein/rubredoxin
VTPGTPFEKLPGSFFYPPGEDYWIFPKEKWVLEEEAAAGKGETWACNECGMVYDPTFGYPWFFNDEGGGSFDEVQPGTPFEKLDPARKCSCCLGPISNYSRRVFGEVPPAGSEVVWCHPRPVFLHGGGAFTRERPTSFIGGHVPAVSVVFSPDGKWWAQGGSKSGSMRRTDFRGLVMDFTNPSTFAGVCFSPDSKRLATASWDGSVRAWEVGESKPMVMEHEFRVPDVGDETSGLCGCFFCVAWSPDGKRLAAGTDYPMFYDMDAMTELEYDGEPCSTDTMLWETGKVCAVAFSPDSKRVVIGGEGDVAWIRDVESGDLVHKLARHGDGKSYCAVRGVAWSPDGAIVATCATDKAIRLWDARTGGAVRVLPGAGVGNGEGHAAAVCSVAFSPDGRLLASGSADWTARVWDVATGRLLKVFDDVFGAVYSVAWAPGGRTLAAACGDGSVLFWDVATLQPPAALHIK